MTGANPPDSAEQNSNNNSFLPAIDQNRRLISNAQENEKMFSAMDRSTGKDENNIVPQLYGDDDQNLEENNVAGIQ